MERGTRFTFEQGKAGGPQRGTRASGRCSLPARWNAPDRGWDQPHKISATSGAISSIALPRLNDGIPSFLGARSPAPLTETQGSNAKRSNNPTTTRRDQKDSASDARSAHSTGGSCPNEKRGDIEELRELSPENGGKPHAPQPHDGRARGKTRSLWAAPIRQPCGTRDG